MSGSMDSLIARVGALAQRFERPRGSGARSAGTRVRVSGPARTAALKAVGATSPRDFQALLAGALAAGRNDGAAAGSARTGTSGVATGPQATAPGMPVPAGMPAPAPSPASATGNSASPLPMPPAGSSGEAVIQASIRTINPPASQESSSDKAGSDAILDIARQQVGKPYRWGAGRGGSDAFDCSGFVSWVYGQKGQALPAFTDTAFKATVPIEHPEPGDLVFYDDADPMQPGVRYPHVGIFAGDGKMIDAAASGGVQVRALRTNPIFRRLTELPSAETVAAGQTPAAPADQRDPRARITAIIARVAKDNQLDPNLVTAIVQAESSFDPRAVSPVGAKGLMQLMDGTARQLGVSDPFEPEQNLTGGAQYLRSLLDRYQNDPRLALAAYNAGPGAVDRYGGVPPFAETRAYIAKVLAAAANTTREPR